MAKQPPPPPDHASPPTDDGPEPGTRGCAVVLALGGGGARGVAHLGFLQVLLRTQVRVSAVAGSSIGAVVAALLATGTDFEHSDPLLDRLRRCAPHNPLPHGSLSARVVGLFQAARLIGSDLVGLGAETGACLEADLREMLGDRDIASLPLPLALTATDLLTNEYVELRRGPLARAVHASAALPGVFTPVPWGDRLLADGGILANVPVRAARHLRQSNEPVVAVSVSPPPASELPRTGFGLLLHSSQLCAQALQERDEQEADVVVRVDLPADLSVFDFERSDEALAAGRAAGSSALGTIATACASRGAGELDIPPYGRA